MLNGNYVLVWSQKLFVCTPDIAYLHAGVSTGNFCFKPAHTVVLAHLNDCLFLRLVDCSMAATCFGYFRPVSLSLAKLHPHAFLLPFDHWKTWHTCPFCQSQKSAAQTEVWAWYFECRKCATFILVKVNTGTILSLTFKLHRITSDLVTALDTTCAHNIMH